LLFISLTITPIETKNPIAAAANTINDKVSILKGFAT
jgi:hypothetical protein